MTTNALQTIKEHHQEKDILDINWDKINRYDFWEIADNIQTDALNHSKALFKNVESMDKESLINVLIQYRYFTIYYIPDLALLIARMPKSKLRSFLGDILNDELGLGDPERAHPQLYDNFLKSLGVSDENLDSSALASNVKLLDSAREQLVEKSNSSTFGIGLRGMGGECVCQIYISELYSSLIKNKFIEKNKNSIDWRFWDLHVGDHDIEHRLETRKLIDKEIVKNLNQSISALGKGYAESMLSWLNFWDNTFKFAISPDPREMTKVNHFVNVSI